MEDSSCGAYRSKEVDNTTVPVDMKANSSKQMDRRNPSRLDKG